jgi:hypothetical protein
MSYSTYYTILSISNQTTMSIATATLRYKADNFERASVSLAALFSTSPSVSTDGDFTVLTGPMNLAAGAETQARVEIYEGWGYDPITITLTYSDQHVVTFNDVQRDAYSKITGKSVAIIQGQGTNKIDNMNVVESTSSDSVAYIVTYTIYQENVPLTSKRWLAKLSGNVLLSDINLPGSHDSAAIFPIPHGFWADQDASITEQLEGGVRALDVRLKVFAPSSGSTDYTFATCHGKINVGPAKWGLGVYESLESLLQQCDSFLARNSTETIVMSVKIDDWNGNNGAMAAALTSLRKTLHAYPVLTGLAGMPTLREARGKIYLWNRIDQDPALGVPLEITDNQQGFSPSGAFPIYVQDHYCYTIQDGFPFPSDAEADKMIRVKNAFAFQTNGVKWNFVSAVYGAKFWQPIGVDINADLLSWLGFEDAAKRPPRLGWCFFDMVMTQMATSSGSPNVPKEVTWPDMVIWSNFSYENLNSGIFQIR